MLPLIPVLLVLVAVAVAAAAVVRPPREEEAAAVAVAVAAAAAGRRLQAKDPTDPPTLTAPRGHMDHRDHRGDGVTLMKPPEPPTEEDLGELGAGQAAWWVVVVAAGEGRSNPLSWPFR